MKFSSIKKIFSLIMQNKEKMIMITNLEKGQNMANSY